MRTLWIALAALLPLQPAFAAIELHGSGAKQNFLYEQDSKALATVVQLVIRAGSTSDPKGKEGISDLAYDSLFRGTKNLDRKDFNATLERLGGSIGVDVGTTRTIVTLTVVSENLNAAIRLLSDSVIHPALKDDEIKSLAEEKLASLQLELSSNRSVMKRVFRQAIYQGTTLAFPPEGTIEGMKAIEPSEVRAFLASQVKAENLVFAVSSNRPEKEVRSMIQRAFGAMPEGDTPDAPSLNPAGPKGRTLYLVERKGSSTTELAIGALGIKADRADREVLETGDWVFGEGSMNARLFKILRSQNGWTYGAYSGFGMLDLPRRFGSSYLIYAFPQKEHTEKLAVKAIELYDDYIKKGITAEELSFAKQSMTNSYPFKFATSRSRLSARLYQLLDGAPLHSVGQYRSIINKVTTDGILKAIPKVHNTENLAIVAVGDPDQIEGLKKAIPNIKNVVKVTDPMKAF